MLEMIILFHFQYSGRTSQTFRSRQKLIEILENIPKKRLDHRYCETQDK